MAYIREKETLPLWIVPADFSTKLPPYDTILTSQILMHFVLSSRRQVLESHKLLLDLTQVIDVDVMLIIQLLFISQPIYF
jgi:hypothetical protein